MKICAKNICIYILIMRRSIIYMKFIWRNIICESKWIFLFILKFDCDRIENFVSCIKNKKSFRWHRFSIDEFPKPVVTIFLVFFAVAYVVVNKLSSILESLFDHPLCDFLYEKYFIKIAYLYTELCKILTVENSIEGLAFISISHTLNALSTIKS